MANSRVAQVAANLEQFGTSRANFYELHERDRKRIARRIAVHLTRQEAGGPVRDEEQQLFFYLCAEVGVRWSDTKAMWYNATRGMSWEEFNRNL